MVRPHPGPTPADIPATAAASVGLGGPRRDLCSTCNHAETCGYRRDPQRPVFFCEEFQVSLRVPSPEPAAPVPGPLAAGESANHYRGLCLNCRNRETCRMTKPEGGIWHCEEYL